MISNILFTLMTLSLSLSPEDVTYKYIAIKDDVVIVQPVFYSQSGNSTMGDSVTGGILYCKSMEWFCSTGFGGLAFPLKESFKSWDFNKQRFNEVPVIDFSGSKTGKEFIKKYSGRSRAIRVEDLETGNIRYLLIVEQELVAIHSFEEKKADGSLSFKSIILLESEYGFGSKQFSNKLKAGAIDNRLLQEIVIIDKEPESEG